MDEEEILDWIVLKPSNRSPFKYGCREVSNDHTIEIVNQLITVVDTLIELKNDTEDRNIRRVCLAILSSSLEAEGGWRSNEYRDWNK